MTILHVLAITWLGFMWLVVAGIIAWFAKRSGRSAILWFFLGLFLAPIAAWLFRDRA